MCFKRVCVWQIAMKKASISRKTLRSHVFLIRTHPKKAVDVRQVRLIFFSPFGLRAPVRFFYVTFHRNVFHQMHLILPPVQPNRILAPISMFFMGAYKTPERSLHVQMCGGSHS